jgi:hypothetical protein
LKAFFLDHQADDFTRTQVRRYASEETGHGRKDERSYFSCPVPDDLPDAGRWKQLKAIGLSINKTLRNGKETTEARYYILSKNLLYSEQKSLRKKVCRSGSQPLGNRKQFALETGCDIRRRPITNSQGPCGRKLQHTPTYGSQLAQTRRSSQSGDQKQKAHRS